MILLQINIADSLAQTEDTIANISETSGMNMDLWGSIAMPFIILVFCSFVKNFAGVSVKEIDWFDLFAEMAIDLLTIFGSFIIGRYFLVTSSQTVLMSSSGKVGIMAVAIIVVAVFRRFAHHFIQKSKPNYLGAGIMLFMEYVFDVLCVLMVF